MTASTLPPVNLACLTAQRKAAREDGEPSTPTTILGTPSALPADIGTRSLRVLRPPRRRVARPAEVDLGSFLTSPPGPRSLRQRSLSGLPAPRRSGGHPLAGLPVPLLAQVGSLRSAQAIVGRGTCFTILSLSRSILMRVDALLLSRGRPLITVRRYGRKG